MFGNRHSRLIISLDSLSMICGFQKIVLEIAIQLH